VITATLRSVVHDTKTSSRSQRFHISSDLLRPALSRADYAREYAQRSVRSARREERDRYAREKRCVRR